MLEVLISLARDELDQCEVVAALVGALNEAYRCGEITGQSSDYAYPFHEELATWIADILSPSIEAL